VLLQGQSHPLNGTQRGSTVFTKIVVTVVAPQGTVKGGLGVVERGCKAESDGEATAIAPAGIEP
jgi:hypothetical protein